MRRPTKLNFKPLSLAETARLLGVPRARALRILALVGVGPEALRADARRTKGKARKIKTSSRGAKSLNR
jgi:hypothetical protein